MAQCNNGIHTELVQAEQQGWAKYLHLTMMMIMIMMIMQ